MEKVKELLRNGSKLRYFVRYMKEFKTRKSASVNEEIVTTMRFASDYCVNFAFPRELMLYDCVITASKLHHGLCRSKVKKLSFELVMINELHTPERCKDKKRSWRGLAIQI